MGCAGPSERRPGWSDEPPALARLLESGYRAEAGRQPGLAAAHYCGTHGMAVSRASTAWGAWRTCWGGGGPGRRRWAATLLSIALAQRGHEKAQGLVSPLAAAEKLPDCLITGKAPEVLVAADSGEAVPGGGGPVCPRAAG